MMDEIARTPIVALKRRLKSAESNSSARHEFTQQIVRRLTLMRTVLLVFAVLLAAVTASAQNPRGKC